TQLLAEPDGFHQRDDGYDREGQHQQPEHDKECVHENHQPRKGAMLTKQLRVRKHHDARAPRRRPGAGRSCSTSRRKRNSAAGRPPVAVEVSPVGSTNAAASTRRRKFCLCRRRPEIASTVRCSSVSVNSRAITSKMTGRYLSLARSRAIE